MGTLADDIFTLTIYIRVVEKVQLHVLQKPVGWMFGKEKKEPILFLRPMIFSSNRVSIFESVNPKIAHRSASPRLGFWAPVGA